MTCPETNRMTTKSSSRTQVGCLMNPLNMDLLFTLAGLGDVVGSLHPHKGVHLHSKSFLHAERHVAGEVSLAVEKTGQRGPGNPQRRRRRRYRQACGFDDLGANEISGMGRIL